MKKSSKTNSNVAKNRISDSVRIQVLTEAGYMCANPRCKHILTLELHHIEWVKDGGGNEANNLIALCSNCHDLHTRGHIHRNAIYVWKQMLQIVNGSLDRESLDILLFMYNFEKKSYELEEKWGKWCSQKEKELNYLKSKDETTQKEIREVENRWNSLEPDRGENQPIRVTGDGLLRLVRLIRTGLVDEGIQQVEGSGWFYYFFWEPKLTKMGRKLAESYLSGDAKTFKEILTGNYDN